MSKEKNDSIRVRFAPSPTGALHIGGVRTALYNYWFARQMGGTMVLRLEDTDQSRFVSGAEQYIQEALQWIGIDVDEGPEKGGPFGPYTQSERKAIYHQYAIQLIDAGNAYYAFDTAEELEALRQKSSSFLYGTSTRMQLNNSLVLSEKEVLQKIQDGAPYVIRTKIPENEEVEFTDIIRGTVIVHSSQLDDKVLMKSDGMPTYHLANVVDDHLMKISHVIRGEEWLPSAPLHVLLYRYLGWSSEMPQFAHLPLLLKPEGKGKLSKRDADKMGFPIFPLTWTDPKTNETSVGFKETGYAPEALSNFLALLGWNPGTDQEIFNCEQLINTFSLDRVGKAGAHFDIKKALWFNQQYLRAQSDDVLATYLLEDLSSNNLTCSPEKARLIAGALRERITFPKDLFAQGKFFFVSPTAYDQSIIAKRWNENMAQALTTFCADLKALEAFTIDTVQQQLTDSMKSLGLNSGKIMQLLRLAVTGMTTGPDLMLSMVILGQDETGARITSFIDNNPL